MSETSHLWDGEGYGACTDEATVVGTPLPWGRRFLYAQKVTKDAPRGGFDSPSRTHPTDTKRGDAIPPFGIPPGGT